MAIFGRKKKRAKSQSTQSKTQPVSQQPEPTVNKEDTLPPATTQDTHIQDAQTLINTLENDCLVLPGPSEHNPLPNPIPISEAHPNYSPETLERLEYQITTEDTNGVISLSEQKSISELDTLINTTQLNIKAAEASAEDDIKSFLELTNIRQALIATEKATAEEYNQELAGINATANAWQENIKEQVEKLKEAETSLTDLIALEKEAELAYNRAKEKVITQTSDLRQLLEDFTNLKEVSVTESNKSTAALTAKLQQAEKSAADLLSNEKLITALLKKIADTNKDLAIAQLTIQIAGDKKAELKAIDAARIAAEQKAREEAEAKAKAEAEARRKEEEQRRREEAKRLLKEQRRIEEEQKKQELARMEAERIAGEQAERERLEKERLEQEAQLAREKELKAKEALKKPQQTTDNVSQDNVSRETSEKTELFTEGQQPLSQPSSHTLTPAEQAEQAKAMMAAQRERRRLQAEEKRLQAQKAAKKNSEEDGEEDTTSASTGSLKSPVQQKATGPDVREETVVKEEPAPDPQPAPTVGTGAPNKKTPEKELSSEADRMDEIRAAWELENAIQRAMKAGDIDTALKLAQQKSSATNSKPV